MTSHGSFDKPVLLHEANFKQWPERMRRILKIAFPDIGFTFSDYYCFFWSGRSDPDSEISAAFATIMWCNVSRHIKLRVSQESRRGPESLINALYVATRPFRLMDLPPELRSRIYSETLPSTSSRVTLPTKYTGENRSRSAPMERSLLAVSRQVRVETLPIYYRDTEFVLMWDYDFVMGMKHVKPKSAVRAERIKAIRDWAAVLQADSLRQLRKVSVQPSHVSLRRRFSLVSVNGKFEMSVAKCDQLTEAKQQLLEEHVAASNSIAQGLRLEGEALILVLTNHPEIWQYLERS